MARPTTTGITNHISFSSSSSSSSLLPAIQHAIAGSAGTVISTWTTYPLSLATTRLQAQRQLAREGGLDAENAYKGIVDALSRTFVSSGGEEGGLKALYTGLAQESAKCVLDSFLFFMFYEWFRARRLRSRGATRSQGLGAFDELAVGVAAGACSRLLTTPFANIVTRKQTAPGEMSVRDIAAAIMKEKGIKGFWSGYSATLILTLNPSITFFLQHFLTKKLLSSERRDDPGPQMTFLPAAMSKAIASAITYPFQTAKTRLQASAAVDSEPESRGSQEHVDKQVEDKLKAARVVQRIAQQSIFGTIAHIIRTEGVISLYDGIQVDLLKGFFGHGMTMLVKDVVHKLLLKFYLLIAGILADIRSTRERTQQFRQRVVFNMIDGRQRWLGEKWY